MFRSRPTFCLVLAGALLILGASASLAEPAAPSASLAPGPMLVIENVGQWPAAARFQVWGSPLGTGTTWLAQDGIWLVVSERVAQERVDNKPRQPDVDPRVHLSALPSAAYALKITFPGSNPNVRIEPFDVQETIVSYLLGDDPDQWHRSVPVWGGVRYVDLYPGLDLTIDSFQGEWMWHFDSRRSGHMNNIQLRIDGSSGLSVAHERVRIQTELGILDLPLPSVPGAYSPVVVSGLIDHTPLWESGAVPEVSLSHEIGPTNDPSQLVYGSYLGGVLWSEGYAAVTDPQGRLTVTGRTHALDFPTTPGAFDVTFGGGICGVPPNTYPCSDAFITQLNADGSGLVFSTFLGGSSWDVGTTVQVTSSGDVVVAGQTASDDFPTTAGAFDTTCGTDGHCNDNGTERYADGFVAMLRPDGDLLGYSTYLGGSSDDLLRTGYLDASGRLWIGGYTWSDDLPCTPGAFDTQLDGASDGFAARMSADGGQLEYGTFVGGEGEDSVYAIAADPMDRMYLAGRTTSADFPATLGAFDRQLDGPSDGFAMRLDTLGATAEYATYLGGSSDDLARSLAVDAEGRAYLGGDTNSDDFPVTDGAYDPIFGGGICYQNLPCYDGFVTRLDNDGSVLEYATYVGGSNNDYLRSVAVDALDRIAMSGITYSADFPSTPDAFDTSFDGHASDCFVSRLDATGSTLAYSTFMGGMAHEWTCSKAMGASNHVYVTGETQGSSDFPTTAGAFDPSLNGRTNLAFVVKLAISDVTGDFDGDGTVDVDDIIIIADLWGQAVGFPYDQDGDGWITIVDIQRVARWWGWAVP